jgi:hypothetical protein
MGGTSWQLAVSPPIFRARCRLWVALFETLRDKCEVASTESGKVPPTFREAWTPLSAEYGWHLLLSSHFFRPCRGLWVAPFGDG